MTLSEQVERIQNLITRGNLPNEASISQGIILPILQELGWDIYDPGFVVPEYSISGGRVDFALLDRRNRPVVFIEVKMLGNIESAEEQLFTYAYHQGVPFLILTDGKEWNFFLPQEVGSYQDRKLYKLDLLDRNIETINEKLFRYLEYRDVINGNALDNAKDDFRKITKSREAQLTIPEAWKVLIQAQDELLIDLLSDKVESICGFRPNKIDCIDFLENHYSYTKKIETKPKVITRKERIETKSSFPSQIYFSINGEKQYCSYMRDVYINILKYLGQRDSNFLTSFERIAHGKKRKYIAQTKEELYPGRPDFYNSPEKYSEFLPGWWVGLNMSGQSMERVIQMALEHAGIRKGSEIDYSLG
jgi:predicted type IV restriction endonuclease